MKNDIKVANILPKIHLPRVLYTTQMDPIYIHLSKNLLFIISY